MTSLLAPAPRAVPRRRIGTCLVVAAVGLAAWAFWLSGSLDPAVHRWHWVGLDAVEVLGLLATAGMVLRGRRWAAAALALLTAPLFWYDAALDCVSSHGSPAELWLAAAMMVGAEIPMSVALVWVAARCLCARPRGPVAGPVVRNVA